MDKDFIRLEETKDQLIGEVGTQKRDDYEEELRLYAIGAAIRQTRKLQNLTQEELGRMVGVQKAQISRIENGKNLTFATVLKLFKAMNISVQLDIDKLGRVALCSRPKCFIIQKSPNIFFIFKNSSYLCSMKQISLFTFSSIVSIGTLLLYNIPFFNYVAQNTNESLGGKIFLLTSLVIIMLALNFMMTYLVMWLMRMVGRILLAILSIINATAVYFVYTYSVMIDATTIENVFNTRYSEASGFFSWPMWLSIIGFGLLPALFCLLWPVRYDKAKKLGIYCGSSLAIVAAIAAMNIGQTLFVTQHDTELGGLLQPWSYVVNTGRVLSFQHDEQAEEIKLPDGKITDTDKAVVVLVIGESARKANFQLYGYERDTNPLLSKQEGLKVYETTACATYTTAGSL